MEYTQQDIIEMKELMVDNYYRCLTLEQEAEVDDIVYTVREDGKIIALKYINSQTLCITDIFDEIDAEMFKFCPAQSLVWDKEVLNTSLLYSGFGKKVYIKDVSAEGCKSVFTSNVTDRWSSFEYNDTVTDISLRNCVKIGRFAFRKFVALKSIDVSNVEEVGDSAFKGCKSVTELNLSKAKSIGKRAFEGMTALGKVDLSSAEFVGYDAFNNCTKLKTLILSNKCKKLEDCVFHDLIRLQNIQFKGTKGEWQKLAKNAERLRGESVANYKKNQFKITYLSE